MRHMRVYVFVSVMWVLMIIGGGVATVVLGSAYIDDADDNTLMILSVGKGIAAILLVIAWVYILIKLKRMIFESQKFT